MTAKTNEDQSQDIPTKMAEIKARKEVATTGDKDKGKDESPIVVSGAMFDMLTNSAVLLGKAQTLLIHDVDNGDDRIKGDPEFALRYLRAATESMVSSFNAVADLVVAAKSKDGNLARLTDSLFGKVSGLVGDATTDPGALPGTPGNPGTPTAPANSRLGHLLGTKTGK